MIPAQQDHTINACLGLPLEQALLLCKKLKCDMAVCYTGEREKQQGLTPRVVAVRDHVLVVSLFRDGDPKQPENGLCDV